MADRSGISWLETRKADGSVVQGATWNPLRGCSAKSAGCTNCYAQVQAERIVRMDRGRGIPEGKGSYDGLVKMTSQGPRWTGEVRLVPDLLNQPLAWTRPRKIFVNSMSDLFHEKVPFGYVDAVFDVMRRATHHIFMVLTKRPERMVQWFEHAHDRWPDGIPAHIWMGVTVEDQAAADERLPLLLKVPAAVRWASCEPLIGPVDLRPYLRGMHWVVAGAESGDEARPAHPLWFRLMRDHCAEVGVPFHFKQWGEWAPRSRMFHVLTNGMAASEMDPDSKRWEVIRLTGMGRDGRQLGHGADGNTVYMQRVGTRLSGRELDGCVHDACPTVAPQMAVA